jgi:hypothetical protein
VVPRHSSPVRRGRRVTWLHCHYRPLLPLKLERFWWHSYALLRDAVPDGAWPQVVAQLLLFLLEEFSLIAAYTVSPLAMGSRVVPSTLAHLDRLLCPSVLGIISPTSFCIVTSFFVVMLQLIGHGPYCFFHMTEP